jgi:hypothetical protein
MFMKEAYKMQGAASVADLPCAVNEPSARYLSSVRHGISTSRDTVRRRTGEREPNGINRRKIGGTQSSENGKAGAERSCTRKRGSWNPDGGNYHATACANNQATAPAVHRASP